MSKQYDLTNKTFGNLTVLEKYGSISRSNGRSEIQWTCKCSCGNIIQVNTANLNDGHITQCSQCGTIASGLKRRKDLTNQKFGKLTVKKMLYNYNNTNKTKCLCDCDCGKTDVIKIPYKLTNGDIKSCGCIKGISQRQSLVGNKYGRLMVIEECFSEKDDYNHKVVCQCDCGNIVTLSRRDVMTGHTRSCGCLRQETFKNINTVQQSGIISDYGIEILDEYGKNDKGQTLWNCKCGICGKIFQELPARIKNNHVRSCGCLIRSSRELYIESILQQENVNYTIQYTFEDCKSPDSNYVLRFDFAIFDSSFQLLCLIEYDGEQHFFPIELFGGEDGFKKTQQRDLIKNNYCISHHIQLYRIPYTFTEQQIKEQVYNILESVTTTGGV